MLEFWFVNMKFHYGKWIFQLFKISSSSFNKSRSLQISKQVLQLCCVIHIGINAQFHIDSSVFNDENKTTVDENVDSTFVVGGGWLRPTGILILSCNN